MSVIDYTSDPEVLTPSALRGFFVGWPTHPDPETHLRILLGSAHVWLAMDGERCVGFVNAITDGVFYAYVPLLEVLPDRRGRGIGRQLVTRMLGTLEGMYAVDFVCDESAVGFYGSLGLARCVAMVKRNDARQAGG